MGSNQDLTYFVEEQHDVDTRKQFVGTNRSKQVQRVGHAIDPGVFR